MARQLGKWTGGRILQGRNGQLAYEVRKLIRGTAYRFLLDARSEAEAHSELALFMRDPSAYRTKEQAEEEAEAGKVTITTEVLQEYMNFLADRPLSYRAEHGEPPKDGPKARAAKYRIDTYRHLEQWREALEGRDLRNVQHKELVRLLEKRWKAGRNKRIAHFKAFCSWLEERGELKPEEDPTRALHADPARPEKAKRAKGYSMAEVEAFYAAVEQQEVRDLICLHAKTGMHVSEAERMASGGAEFRAVDHDVIKSVVSYRHKSGMEHKMALDAQATVAAQRLIALGAAPDYWRVRRTLKATAEELGVRVLNLGALRHSFAGWAIEQGELVTVSGRGVALEIVSGVLGHLSVRTTKLHYDTSTVPPCIVLPLKLEHPDDP